MKLLTTYLRRSPRLRGLAACALAGMAATASWAQSLPPAASDSAAVRTKAPDLPNSQQVAAPGAATKSADAGAVISLSPFEVKSNAVGYFESNAMSGTRLNSKIEDLGQSITVMTKEQMSDFAMLDVNDVFNYMAGTEGTDTYSDFEVDRTGAVTDNVAYDPNNANRVRGIGNANIAFDNIATTGRVPIDPLWLDSIELSRGPNANIFGLGNVSGTLNQVPATANVTRDFTQVTGRTDSYGGWRASIDVNRVLLRDKLAIRASWADERTAFVRKPSGEGQRHLSFQVKARPFKGTTLSVSWYNYKNASQRPNFTTPRDYISDWLAAGKPAWNPVTRLITLNGVTYGQGSGGTLAAGSTTPITSLPSYFGGNDSRATFRIGAPGEAPYWSTPTVTSATSPLSAVSNNIRFVQTDAVDNYGASQPLFATTAALADKSIYDWDRINLLSANKQWDDVNMYLAQLDQILLSTSRQTLAAQATFLREDAKEIQNLPLGPASVNGVIGQIYADPNLVNLDGSPNPYFGRPYLKTTEPFLRDRPELWDTYRAQLAYQLDFSRDSGWTKWLGSHQLLGYYEYKDRQSRQYAWRDTAVSRNQQWEIDQFNAGIPLANRTSSGNNYPSSYNYMRLYEQYYVGSTPGGGVQYGPSLFPEGATLPFVWGNTGAFHYDPVQVGFTPSPDGSGGNANLENVIKTQGAVLQSAFLDDSLVTTFGLRRDKIFSRNAPYAVLTPDLLSFDYAASDRWLDGSHWREAQGPTKSASVVLRPFQDLRFLDDMANHGGGLGRFAAQALHGLGLTYNHSDSFIPEGPAYDLFLRPLPNETGTDKEYGLWLNLFDGGLVVRYTHFTTDQVNYRNGDISTIAQRVLRYDGLNANDRWNLLSRATDWVTFEHSDWTSDQVRAEVSKEMGLSEDQINGLESAISTGTLDATQDVVSRGDEWEVFCNNPSRTWTVSASVTKTESINKNAGSTIEDWLNLRMPIWTKIEDPRFTAANAPNLPVGSTGHLLWWNIYGPAFTSYGYDSKNSAATNYVTFVQGPLAVYRQLEGRPRPQLGKYAVRISTRYQLSGITENRILKGVSVGGAWRWDDKKAIGFYGLQSLPATITALDPNRPIYSPAQSYVDLFVAYRTKMYGGKVGATFQLNVKNLLENGGGLLPVQAFPDGTPLAFRIIDPRQFIFSVSFDM